MLNEHMFVFLIEFAPFNPCFREDDN